MKFGPPIRIIAVAAFCALALVGLVVREGAARASGTEAILRMEAVDPRSLLHGHFVIIALQETAAGSSCPPGTNVVPRGAPPRSNWVAFRQNGDHHSVAGVAESREMAAKLGAVAARGGAWCEATSGTIRTEIGIDRFHVSQAEAQRIERILRTQRPGEARVSAIISIGRDGRARLKGLIVDGERIELRWL